VNVAEAPVLPKKLAVREEMVAFSAIRRSPFWTPTRGNLSRRRSPYQTKLFPEIPKCLQACMFLLSPALEMRRIG
jgi:hypothetical protein